MPREPHVPLHVIVAREQVTLFVIGANEIFEFNGVYNLTGDDLADHRGIVDQKSDLYSAYPGFSLVECSCANFSAYILNEPHVKIPLEKINPTLL